MIRSIIEHKIEVEFFINPNINTTEVYKRMQQLDNKINALVIDFCEQHKIPTPNGSLQSRIIIEKT